MSPCSQMIRWLLISLAIALATSGARAQSPSSGPVRVVAASNLQPALAELAPLFERQHPGTKVAVTLGASANLVRQIQQGLPADVFLSADEEFANRLADVGLTVDRGAIYATGRVVLLVPSNSGLALDARLSGLKGGLNQITKFALANP